MPLESETVKMFEAAALQLSPAEQARLIERSMATAKDPTLCELRGCHPQPL